VHLAEMMMGREVPESAGDYLLVATGVGDSIIAARRKAQRVLNRLSMPHSPYHRIDIGTRLRSQLDELQRHGFAEGMRYS
jgi:phosphoribosylamine--glycine ligase